MADNLKWQQPLDSDVELAADEIDNDGEFTPPLPFAQRLKLGQGAGGQYADVSSGGPLYATAGADAANVGWQWWFDDEANLAVETVKSSRGVVAKIIVANLDVDTRWLQMFGVTGVILGSTTPLFAVPIRPGDGATKYGRTKVVMDTPIEFAANISYAVTTTPTGNVGPTNDAKVTLFYR